MTGIRQRAKSRIITIVRTGTERDQFGSGGADSPKTASELGESLRKMKERSEPGRNRTFNQQIKRRISPFCGAAQVPAKTRQTLPLIRLGTPRGDADGTDGTDRNGSERITSGSVPAISFA